jgi:uncharacterized protein DUF4124
MQRLYPLLALGLLTACAAATATAGDVYQWKDARGVTQYSSTPPATGAYKVRAMHGDQVQLETAAAKPAENPGCAIARKNMELLQGKSAIQIDSNGDGKPDKTLSDDDRANQMQLAQATLKVNCAVPVVADKAIAGQ